MSCVKEFAQGCDVNSVMVDLVSEGFDEAAHGCGLNQDGMHVDSL